MKSLISRLAALVVLTLLVGPVAAQQLPLAIEFVPPGVDSYDPDVPTPEEVIGHRIGTQHTTPAEAVRYFEVLAEASDRIMLQQHALSYEGRPLVHAVVTAPEHFSQLDALRDANARLSEAPQEVDDEALVDQPAVVYMGYSVHGNEASGTEAALLLLYHLAAGQGPAVDDVLQQTVTIVDPMFNPDGRDRFVDWVNRHRGGVHTTDPQDLEHDEAWPGGRTNHYWFDLNRDWLPAQHPESQGRLEVFHRWRPQVLTDYHEMGKNATYFFQPGIPSRTNPNTPELNQQLTGRIAERHAAILDDIGSLYYTRESFDDFYYGKGSTYPDLNGGVGILFEQASSRALESETVRGPLPYAFTIRNQIATSISTLQAVTEMREDLLRYQRDYYRAAAEEAGEADVQAYVLSLEGDRTRVQALAQVLQRHRVKVYDLARPFERDGQSFQPGEALVVPVDQQQARLVKAFMERTTSFPDSLFYDVSTWTLPLAFGIEYAEVERDADGYLGAERPAVELDGGRVEGGSSDYAYILRWDRYLAPRALYQLQQIGARPQLMMEPFTAVVDGEAVSFERGSIVVPVANHGRDVEGIHMLVQQVAKDDHVRVAAVDGGLTPEGPDLGSRGAAVLEMPSIALVVGEGTSAYNAGEVWHLLAERFRVPVSLIDVRDAGDLDLTRYNTMVLAGGYYSHLDDAAVRSWVEEGGRLVALDDAIEWVAEQRLLELEEREGVNYDSVFAGRPYAELDRARGAQYLGGSIFEVELDPTHPVAYGYGEAVPVFRRGTSFFEPTGEAGVDVGRFSDEPVLSGYAAEETVETARGAAGIVADRYGSGRVIALAFNPNFRAFWYGTNGLFLNSIFLGGAF